MSANGFHEETNTDTRINTSVSEDNAKTTNANTKNTAGCKNLNQLVCKKINCVSIGQCPVSAQ